MASKKPSMIDALRAKHDPHYQLASKVEGLGKDLPIQVAQLHKTCLLYTYPIPRDS